MPTAAMLIDGTRFGDEFLADCSPGSGRGRRADGVNVRCWQETYRGLMSDAVLDDPGFLAARERFWTVALTDERYRENRVAVAERDGELVGIAMSGPPLDATATWARQLYVLSEYAADHGALREPGRRCPAATTVGASSTPRLNRAWWQVLDSTV